MFQRKGYVRVALDRTEDIALFTEKLLDVALSSTADDFAESDGEGPVTEIEVSDVL
jgi:transcriptional/translational regulatory protein YebC/TACO1